MRLNLEFYFNTYTVSVLVQLLNFNIHSIGPVSRPRLQRGCDEFAFVTQH